MLTLNAEARALVDQFRRETQDALVTNQASADEQVAALRAGTHGAITTLDGKIQQIEDMTARHESTRSEPGKVFDEQVETMTTLEGQLRVFATAVASSSNGTQASFMHLSRQPKDPKEHRPSSRIQERDVS